MPDVVLWGATGHSRVINEALFGTEYRIAAIFDIRDLPPPLPNIPLYKGKIAFSEWLSNRGNKEPLYFCTAIGGGHGRDRMEIHEYLCLNGLEPLTVNHRTAFIAIDAVVGSGCQILAHAAVCSYAQLGRNVIINTSASVDHDCKIGDGVHIGPGAKLAGEVIVGAYAFIGIGAVVLPRLFIGEDAVVGAGAIITKNVQPGEIVVGNPARQLRKTHIKKI